MPVVYKKKVNKNQNREKKINQKVSQLYSKILKTYEQFLIGDEIPLVTDTLGNKYLSFNIGPRQYLELDHSVKGTGNRDAHWSDNEKTSEIYNRLYAKLKEFNNLVFCQCLSKDGRTVEGWLLVEEIQPKPDNSTTVYRAEENNNE